MTPAQIVTRYIGTRAAPRGAERPGVSPRRKGSNMRLTGMRFKLVFALAVVCAVVFALPAWTHHSHGNYEDTFMDIQGVVTELHLVVPHSWIYLETKDAKGEP